MPCHSCHVSLLSIKWLWIFWAWARLASLIARANAALAVLRAYLSSALKAMSLWLSAVHVPLQPSMVSGLTSGGGLDDSDVISALADEASNWWCVLLQVSGAVGSCCLPKHLSVSGLKTVLDGRDGSLWPGLHLSVSLSKHLTSGLYAGITEKMWSEYPR